MSDKLTEIMAWKRQEIAPFLRAVSATELARLDASLPRPPSFAAALQRGDGTLAVISEIKRRSPSAGDIKAGVSSVDQAIRYQSAGADALSVLTDEKFLVAPSTTSVASPRIFGPRRPPVPASARISSSTLCRCSKPAQPAPAQSSLLSVH